MSTPQQFTVEVDDWVAETKERLEAVFRIASQNLFYAVILPVNEGGRMRVDTGFLRSSFKAFVEQPLITLTGRPEGDAFSADLGQISLTIASAELGDTIFFASSANYARPREYGSRGRPGDGFIQVNAERWPDFVNEAVLIIKGG